MKKPKKRDFGKEVKTIADARLIAGLICVPAVVLGAIFGRKAIIPAFLICAIAFVVFVVIVEIRKRRRG